MKIEVENVNVPGYTTNVDKEKYTDMKKALLKVLPKKSPGFTGKKITQAVADILPQSTFPSGKAAGWWAKTVQLDLEAKGVIKRADTKPLRWYRLK